MAMSVIDVQNHARRLFDQHGSKAMAIAAQKAKKLQEQGDEAQARDWRRIEAAMSAKRGAPES